MESFVLILVLPFEMVHVESNLRVSTLNYLVLAAESTSLYSIIFMFILMVFSYAE